MLYKKGNTVIASNIWLNSEQISHNKITLNIDFLKIFCFEMEIHRKQD